MPMSSTHLQSSAAKNARVVPVEPEVKSAKTFKLSKRGVSANAGSAKIADPSCYDSPVGAGETARHGLFDNMERMKMNTVLKWWTGSNGNLFADHKDTRYSVDTHGEPMPFGMRLYFLAANGKSLGGAGTIEQCKHMADRHVRTGKV